MTVRALFVVLLSVALTCADASITVSTSMRASRGANETQTVTVNGEAVPLGESRVAGARVQRSSRHTSHGSIGKRSCHSSSVTVEDDANGKPHVVIHESDDCDNVGPDMDCHHCHHHDRDDGHHHVHCSGSGCVHGEAQRRSTIAHARARAGPSDGADDDGFDIFNGMARGRASVLRDIGGDCGREDSAGPDCGGREGARGGPSGGHGEQGGEDDLGGGHGRGMRHGMMRGAARAFGDDTRTETHTWRKESGGHISVGSRVSSEARSGRPDWKPRGQD